MKRNIVKLFSLALSVVMAFSAADFALPARQAEAKKTYKVVLDAGHDENHPGTRYNGLEEEDITYAIVDYCKEYLEDDYGIKVFLARPEEECPVGGGREINCLEWRPKVAKKKKADIFVSFHINSSINTVPSGVEVWTATLYKDTPVGQKSRELAQKCLSKLLKLGFANRGLKYANHVVTKRANEYGIPACLIEHGFVRNPSDRRWMSSNSKIKKLAKADADAIAEFLKSKKSSSSSDDEEYYDGTSEDDEEVYDGSPDDDEDIVEYYDGNTGKSKKNGNDGVIDEEEEETEEDYVEDSDGEYDEAKLNKSKSGTVYAAVAADQKVTLGSVKSSDDGLVVSWNAFSGAKKYVVFRKEGSEKFQRIGKTKNTNFTDEECEEGVSYTYTVVAKGKGFKTKKNKPGITAKLGSGSSSTTASSTTSSESSSSTKSDQVEITSVKWSGDVVKISWKPVDGAIGYEISRNEDKSGYEALDEVDEDTLSYKDEMAFEDSSYLYRVRAFFEDDEGEYWGTYSKAKSPSNGVDVADEEELPEPTHEIMGESETNPAQMRAYYEAKGKPYPSKVFKKKGAPTIAKFCRIVYDEAESEGVKAEVVFGQICKETNFLQFGGSVSAKQCNFAGIGATDGGGKPETFSDVAEGVRAQVQHLKAYASNEDLENEQVDPRFNHVTRGCAKYVEWLGIKENPKGKGWATAKHYGYSLANGYIDVLLQTE